MAQQHVRLVFEIHSKIIAVWGWLAVVFAFDVKLVQVVVPPAERRLNVLVEIGQGANGNLYAPPDRRFDVEQRDLELVKQVALLRGRLAGLGRFLT